MKYEAFCSSINPKTLEPSTCWLRTFPIVDYTKDIVGSGVPLVMVHGTMDKIIPYINGKEVETQAKKVGLKYDFITIEGASHGGTIGKLVDPNEQYLGEFMTFVSSTIDLDNAECPSQS